VVAVTGSATGLGAALHARLPADRAVALGDVRDPLLESRLAGVGTVVHLDVSWEAALPADERRARTVRGTGLLLEAAARAGVARVVLTTSADVYAGVPGTPGPIPDASALSDVSADGAVVGDHLAVEALAVHAQLIGLAVTVLRPTTLVGGALGPAYDGQLLRQLGGPRLLAVRGVEPLWQLCHTDDLLSALELAAAGRVTGGLAVGSDGALPQSRVEELSGKRRLEVPAGVAVSTAERLHRVRASAWSPRELDHLLAPVVVASDGLRAAGWEPGWTNEAALQAHLADRPADGWGNRALGRGPAGATAASATAALIGTAALVRSARKRRRG
jgi:nucleoside-diphosphate-sugar epimerase